MNAQKGGTNIMKIRRYEAGQGIGEVTIVLVFFVIVSWGIFKLGQLAVSFANEKVNEYNNTRSTESLIIAGKAVNVVTSEWPNDRLVLLFLNGKEVGRTETDLGEFSNSGQGTHDGLFVLRVSNDYHLTLNDFNFEGNRGLDFSREDNPNWPFSNNDIAIYRWFGDVEVGTLSYIPLPAKNLTFAIYIFETPTVNLPGELQLPGSAVLQHDGTIFVNGQPIKQSP
jgi:hypothetical protein